MEGDRSNTTSNCLIIVGRSGNGLTSVENQIQEDISHHILDCSGIGDPGEDISVDERKTHYVELFKKNQTQAVDAIVFVMKYGIRYTKQEKDAVQVVKSVFGDDVFKDKAVIVFTYGDLFFVELQDGRESNNTEFIQWCKEQVGDIQTLFQEADYRCILFDNKTRDSLKIENQLKTFNEFVTHVRDNPFKGIPVLDPPLGLPEEETRKLESKKIWKLINRFQDFSKLLSLDLDKHPKVFIALTIIRMPLRFMWN